MKRDKQLIKNCFEQIEPPAGLAFAVDSALHGTKSGRRRLMGVLKAVGSAAAVFFLTLLILPNISPKAAAAAEKIPVIGDLCRVFTFIHYEKQDIYNNINVTVPKIEINGKSELEKRVNLEIARIVDEEVRESRQRAREYIDAYLATGGDPDEFIPVDICVNYEVKCINREIASFYVYKYETHASFYATTKYFNLDLETGRNLTLKDLLGADYAEAAAEEINRQLALWDSERAAYLFDDIDIKRLITEDRGFYISSDGRKATVVFNKYEIAAGAAGMPEFEIELKK